MLWMGEWPRKPTLGQQDINWIYMEIASLVFFSILPMLFHTYSISCMLSGGSKR